MYGRVRVCGVNQQDQKTLFPVFPVSQPCVLMALLALPASVWSLVWCLVPGEFSGGGRGVPPNVQLKTKHAITHTRPALVLSLLLSTIVS
jgi:hypothetical protein